ncbi:hypothetical protein EX895_006098 [Sporisorium graminicola]|uniref:Uncharacterized protein n=1 Tax=Sporisorium graminicola TaxID=280036 RepID=A0A4U7KPF6_9BASI|nr:hypothetical protein EX895_006098 [Sporisorium graminicola]TKY85018.1 hypothetical protein EX895_006098 [Sporisorium graminicola]
MSSAVASNVTAAGQRAGKKAAAAPAAVATKANKIENVRYSHRKAAAYDEKDIPTFDVPSFTLHRPHCR